MENGFRHKISQSYLIDFIFSHKEGIQKGNIFWTFYKNPTWWRHVIGFSVFVGFLMMSSRNMLTSAKNYTNMLVFEKYQVWHKFRQNSFWRQLFWWWRHQKSDKTDQKFDKTDHLLEIRQLLNHLSYESGWPTKLKLLCRPKHRMSFS